MLFIDKLYSIFNTITFANLHLILIIMVLSFISYLVRSIRHYIMIIDISYSFKNFIPIYCKMTLIHLILPYKLGEFYRLFVISKYVNNSTKGVVSIIVDRFFDTIPLFFIYSISIIFFNIEFSLTIYIVFLFLILGVFTYLTFSACYKYLNEYLITSKTTKNKLKLLSILDYLNEIHSDVKLMFNNKSYILLILSFISRICEYLSLMLIAKFLSIQYSLNVFITYLENIFLGKVDDFILSYFIVGVIILAFSTITLNVYNKKTREIL